MTATRPRTADDAENGPEPSAPPTRRHRLVPFVVIVVSVLVGSVLVVSGVALVLVRPRGAGRVGSPAAAFLDRYLDPDGRVVRHDQGGDTVSEGQAYAMLLAVSTRDRRRFESAWSWTRRNLQRPDGLLSWHWQDGRVADPMPAADADLDAAWALALASRRFGEAGYRDDAIRLAGAILDGETAMTTEGAVLVAGPWARTEPAIANPGYFAPAAAVAIGRLARDPRWPALGDMERSLAGRLVAGGARLPSDWVRITSSGDVAPAASPDGENPRFGLEAARATVWASVSCDARDRRRAAAADPLLGSSPGTLPRGLDGRPASGDVSAVGYVAAAAAARAAGAGRRASADLDAAVRLERDHPTYYGGAWVALAAALFAPDALITC